MESVKSSSMILSLLLLSIFSSFTVLSQTDYSLPDHYFINCGSDSPAAYPQRNFSGDDFHTGDSTDARNSNFTASVLEIYRTARIFKRKSQYKLNLEQNGRYVVRLHFYPFIFSSYNLSDAKFNVTAARFSLLSDFGVGNRSDFPVIHEFLLLVKDSKLRIHFIPSPDSSFAFVNAIEAFLAPDSSIPDKFKRVPEGNNVINDKLSSNVLQVIHRVNAGGWVITPENDTLLRNWVPDDAFLLFQGSEKKIDEASPRYLGGLATRYDAPDPVYNSARFLKIDDNNQTSIPNITWNFRVEKNTPHFIRFHFSNIVTLQNESVFNLSLKDEFIQVVIPCNEVEDRELRTPFYLDYVVNSDASGFLNASVKPVPNPEFANSVNFKSYSYAFLNGLEIMQISKIEAADDESEQHKWKHLLTIIGPCLALLILCGVAIALWFCLKKPGKAKPVEASPFPSLHIPFDQIFGRSSKSQSTDNKSVISISPDMNLGLKLPLSEIRHATKNFDSRKMIGEGGFGKVYRGTMRNGVKVAVKRSEAGHGQGLLEFQTEIMILSKIRHRHLVSLIGYCAEGNEMILVYEFMEKGTLRDHLYTSNHKTVEKSSSELSWVQRLEICIGAAKGLHYLHAGLTSPIIHRDIKSTNILLDEHYVAKVADFGLSRSGPPDQSYVSTDVKGSFGYLDPEYYRCMQLTQKSDVYSFGVVLLEVLCARPAIMTNSERREQVNLAEWGMSWLKKGQLAEIIDPTLVGKIDPSSLRKFGETTEKCLQDYGADRPSMADVSWDLEYALKLQHTGMPLDPPEDSMTDVSLQLPPPVVRRLPSDTMPMSEEEDSRGLGASQVFSQLNIDDAR